MIEVPDPAGQGVLLGHHTDDGLIWCLARDDGGIEALGTYETYHEAVKQRIAASENVLQLGGFAAATS